MPIYSSIFLFYCSSFKVFDLTLKSLIHIELILAQGERQGSRFSTLHVDNQLSQCNLLETVSNICFWHFYKNSAGCYWVGLFLGLSFHSIGLHVFLCQYCAIFVTMALC
jgi:hypothetical protein